MSSLIVTQRISFKNKLEKEEIKQKFEKNIDQKSKKRLQEESDGNSN